jgi:hypothetical protein
MMAAAIDEDARQQRSLVLNDGFTIAFIVLCAAPAATGPTDLHLYLCQAVLNLVAAHKSSEYTFSALCHHDNLTSHTVMDLLTLA